MTRSHNLNAQTLRSIGRDLAANRAALRSAPRLDKLGNTIIRDARFMPAQPDDSPFEINQPKQNQ